MKIKIGNFNFINDSENKLRNFSELQYKDDYFWLDGKENKLFAMNTTKFEQEKYGYSIPDFERKLMERFEIVPLFVGITREINDYVEKKVEKLISSQNYSKYNLYKDIDLRYISDLKYNKDFKFELEDNFAYNFDTNKIEIGVFRYNPYTEKLDNIEECENRLKDIIKKKTILKEIEKGIAPKFVTEVMKINDFLEFKKSCSLIFNGTYEKLPLKHPYTSNIVSIWKNNITLESYNDRFKIQDLKGLMYGKNFFEINSENLMNIDKQIAISLEDRLEQRIDCLKDEIKDEYSKYRYKNEREYYDMPYSMEDVIKKELNFSEEKPKWFTKEVQEMSHEYKLLNYLQKAQTIEEIKEVCVELGDNELQNIYYGMKYEEEDYEEEESI